jgi:rsbT co-antagonist protein RsbR
MSSDAQMIEALQIENERLQQRVATLEKERDEARLAHQQMYEVLMQSPAPIFLLRGENHIYELANPAYLKMVQKTDVIGKPVREVFPELEGQGYFEVLDTIRDSGEGLVQQEFPALIERGDSDTLEQGWFNLVFQPIRNVQGEVDGILHLVVEVSDQVRARQEVERLNSDQEAVLRELSTPLIPISDHVVIMPLIGSIDSQRARMIMEVLLEGVAHYRAHIAMIDITGVQTVDSQVANALIQAAQAVKLLGASVMLTGIQPQIAQTLVHLGVDLSGIQTRGSLQAGFAAVLRQQKHS